jgi:hypothetical protein
VDDDLGALHRGVDPFAAGQVAGHQLDTRLRRTGAAAEDPDIVAGVQQPRDDQPPQGAGAAGDQNGW